MFAGFNFARRIIGKYEIDEEKKRELELKEKKYSLEIQAWILALVTMGALFYFNIKSPLFFGFLTGITLQGLTYENWYSIVNKVKKEHKL